MNIENLGLEIIKNNNVPDFSTRIITNGPPFFHSHSYYEIFYMLSGSVEHYFNGKRETLQAGDLYIMKPGDVHNFLEGNESYSHRDIMFSTTLWERICDFYHIDIFSLLLPSQQKIHLSLDSMKSFEISFVHFNEILEKEKSIENNPFVYIILGDIIKRFLINTSSSKRDIAPPTWFATLINQLSLPENIIRDKREILSGFHYSQEHICRVFKKYMNETLTDYINNKRLDLAVTLLCNTNKTVHDVCHECGFESVPYFTKIFKQKFGVSPAVFKKAPDV